ncbi:hypothetical protein [Cellulomonas soli]|uniref:hypothetical protein n=1 Tax=Cellulomonas soli TaxID=931535 RepID=UPI0011BD721A|nr:hypothetical protein [Cellulomonas soli]NYI58239.1 hypothetical protein [Cellulomonas soli]
MVPPRLSNVSLQFEGWLGDDLIETYPLFAVTDRLRAALRASGVSGVSFEQVPTIRSEQLLELQPGDEIGTWSLMAVTGRAGTDDAWLSPRWMLMVSQRFWDVASRFQLTYCDIAEHTS